tara:strand:+ start:170 stop:511 length:342 start_codon:yes stop_codon:yes gene_type:complete
MALLSPNSPLENTDLKSKYKSDKDNIEASEVSENTNNINLNNPVKKKKSGKKKCALCKKKVGLLGLTCKCGKLFCTNHLHPECHNCSFDHKTKAKEILENKLVKIDAEKIIKI